MTVFWEVTFYSLVNRHQRFEESRWLNYQSTMVPSYQTTRRHTPEVCNLTLTVVKMSYIIQAPVSYGEIVLS
jgi:hypothetical protein